MNSAEAIAAAYALAAGFVSAGLLGSFYQLVTARPPRFELAAGHWLSNCGELVMILFAGPFIIMRNALRGRRIENRPLKWLLASACISSMWSICSGILVLHLSFALAAA